MSQSNEILSNLFKSGDPYGHNLIIDSAVSWDNFILSKKTMTADKPMSSNKSVVSSSEAVSSMDNGSSMSNSNRVGNSMDKKLKTFNIQRVENFENMF